MNSLILENIKKNFSSFSLEVENLNIPKGKIFGLLGESGSGKTTLLKIIAGLTKPDCGKIYLNNSDITHLKTQNRNLGMVFQEDLLFPHMNIFKNIEFGLKMKNIKKDERKEKVLSILQTVGLNGMEYRYPNELSGGQRQRVSLARALVYNPPLLLMDEPFSALDPNLKIEMRNFLKSIHQKYKTTIIFVTHDIEDAFSLFDQMALFKDGFIKQIDTAQNMFINPKNTYVAKFMGIENIFSAQNLNNGFFKTPIGLVRSNLNKDSGYIIASSHLFQIGENENFENLSAQIESFELKKDFFTLNLKIDNHILKIKRPLEEFQNFKINDSIIISFDLKKFKIVED